MKISEKKKKKLWNLHQKRVIEHCFNNPFYKVISKAIYNSIVNAPVMPDIKLMNEEDDNKKINNNG